MTTYMEMKFLALNADFSSPRADPVGLRAQARDRQKRAPL